MALGGKKETVQCNSRPPIEPSKFLNLKSSHFMQRNTMSNSQLQSLFDSVCRCFGHTPTNAHHGPTASEISQTASHSHRQSSQQNYQLEPSHSQVGKRRTKRLGLQDEQWDELFEKNNNNTQSASSNPNNNSGMKAGPRPLTADFNTAQELAQAKLAANPPRYSRTSKRKRSGKEREEIFRNRESNLHGNRASSGKPPPSANPSSFSRLLHPTLAMCFATPIRGTEEEQEESDLRSVDNSDANTLNTCEDTITSTVYYDNKLAHMTETRPPMPLFSQFKIGSSKDEIRNIMASDSHSSANLIQMMQQQQSNRTGDLNVNAHDLKQSVEADSTTEISKSQSRAQQSSSVQPECSPDAEMEDVLPGVKAVSDSSGSDESIRHGSHQANIAGRTTSSSRR